MKKLLFLVGTRPEVIKIAPLLRVCYKKEGFVTRLCTSGQHASLLENALKEDSLSPDLSFTVWGDLSQKTAECLTRFDRVLLMEAPDAVVVHGDTLTAFAGGIAAFHRHIPLFHVEAGLRTDTIASPFPEEFYRRTIDSLATLCFAPTPTAAARLAQEGKREEQILMVGNTVIDTLFADIDPDFSSPLIKEEKKLILMTLHRRETQGEAARRIFHAVKAALREREDTELLFPVHPSPAVKEAAFSVLEQTAGVTLLPPLDKRTFRNLLFRATLILTDSGGVSEEATALGIPTLLLREDTERPEGVEAGVLRPIGIRQKEITSAICEHLARPCARRPSSVFGDGKASERIAAKIEDFFRS